jgi:hypothetical protein
MDEFQERMFDDAGGNILAELVSLRAFKQACEGQETGE